VINQVPEVHVDIVKPATVIANCKSSNKSLRCPMVCLVHLNDGNLLIGGLLSASVKNGTLVVVWARAVTAASAAQKQQQLYQIST